MNWQSTSAMMKQFFRNLVDVHGILIFQAFLVIFGALLVDFIQKRMLGRLYRKLEKTKTPWDDAFVDTLRQPLSLLIWTLGITVAADVVGRESSVILFEMVAPLRSIAVISIIAWFGVRFISRASSTIVRERQADGKVVDVTIVDAVAKLLRVSVFITAGLVIIQNLGFSISGLLAFGGIGGLAVGLAAKDILSNFFGGLMLYMDRPFAVGDWIRSPDKEIEGTVEEIGWRLTRIRTFSKRPLYVPNCTFSTITVENPSRMSNRRIYETIGIRYEDAGKMEKITAEVKKMLIEHPEIDENLTLMVNFNALAPSSLDFFIYCLTHTTVWVEFHEIKQDVLLRIEKIIANHGAEIAFPTSTVHMPDGLALEQLPPRPEPDAAQ